MAMKLNTNLRIKHLTIHRSPITPVIRASQQDSGEIKQLSAI